MASKRAERRKRCERKARHTTRENAMYALYLTKQATGEKDLNAYRCPYCGGWHIGHRIGTLRAKLPYLGKRA